MRLAVVQKERERITAKRDYSLFLCLSTLPCLLSLRLHSKPHRVARLSISKELLRPKSRTQASAKARSELKSETVHSVPDMKKMEETRNRLKFCFYDLICFILRSISPPFLLPPVLSSSLPHPCCSLSLDIHPPLALNSA